MNCDTSWIITGSATNISLSDLLTNTTYYWQVRAVNAGGTTYANTSDWWSFTTITLPPTGCNKLTPANGADDVPINPTLTWQSSPGTSYYEYCYDATINSTCNATWTSVGCSQRRPFWFEQVNPV